MDPNNAPNTPDNEYNPNLEAQDEDVLSGGGNRLTYVFLGLIIALVVGYIALPKGSGSGIASVTPSFMLSDAAVTAPVTAPVPAAEDPAAAKAAAEKTPVTTAAKTTAAVKPATASTTTTTTTAAAPVAADLCRWPALSGR